jgi:hypothetical protein
LLLDFGGVMTSSLYGRMAEFCVEAGLPAERLGLRESADGAGDG